MDIQKIISDIRKQLDEASAAIDTWFDKPAARRTYRPATGGWTMDELLEHIGLTNHYLLILIEKGAAKALRNPHGLDLQAELQTANFNYEKLDEVGQHRAFAWVRPAHMEPTGKPLAEVRQQLRAQYQQCLHLLENLKNGEGVLHKTMMSVNGFGRLNMYEYLYFLAQHTRRHITQMQRNEAEFVAAVYERS